MNRCRPAPGSLSDDDQSGNDSGARRAQRWTLSRIRTGLTWRLWALPARCEARARNAGCALGPRRDGSGNGAVRPALDFQAIDALEISGTKWRDFGFSSYRTVGFSDYDVCAGPLDETFDLVIAEQVLEHVLWPLRAVRHMGSMLRPGGTLLVTTPFLLRVHPSPHDCSRWTELGLKYLLAEAGFELSKITTGAWGNRACVRANFVDWRGWNPMIHSLRNEPEFPVHVWAFAEK